MGQSGSQRMEQRLSAHMLPALTILELGSQDLAAYLREAFESNEALTFNEVPASRTVNHGATERHSEWLNSQPARSESLAERLTAELSFRDLSGFEGADLDAWTRHLIHELDETGLLSPSDDELLLSAKQAGLVAKDVDAALWRSIEVLQDLGAAGLGARSSIEALLLQLDPEDEDFALLGRLLDDFLEELGANKLPAVATSMGIDMVELNRLMGRIAELSAALHSDGGATGIDEGGAPAITPEVIIEEDASNPGSFSVAVDGAAWPEVGLDEDLSLLAADPETDGGLRKYLRGKLEDARLVVSAVEQRRTTLLRVAKAVFAHQRAFLEHGPGHLLPLRQEDLANLLGVHRSTVSRAMAGKYAWTPWGIFPLKHFFQAAAGASTGAARDDVRAVLGRVVENEDPSAPHSDEDLVTLMAKRGFNLARRTVAKYRRELGIPTSYRRRRFAA